MFKIYLDGEVDEDLMLSTMRAISDQFECDVAYDKASKTLACKADTQTLKVIIIMLDENDFNVLGYEMSV